MNANDLISVADFPGPSCTEGIARILDFGGTLAVCVCATSPEMADILAMRADFCQAGQFNVLAIS